MFEKNVSRLTYYWIKYVNSKISKIVLLLDPPPQGG